MRTLRNNKQTIKYANLIGETSKYVFDENGDKVVDFVDSEGTIYYLQTGDIITAYTDPKSAMVNISFGGGEAQAQEFGVDVSAYDATVVYLLDEFPITETSLIWYKTTPTFKDGYVDPNSADYKVLSVKPSLNYTKLLLGKLVK